ncbi:MAG: type II toxin-antitoxin system VapC family toxin [Candidatus Diapherotrites archaeon]|nr:type II toxin-antitoxin system VapC family toxin [Candidatus Diapherotrites archaeon]
MEPTAVVDTSVIIDVMKNKIDVDALPAEDILICAPIRYELLAGARGEGVRKKILELPCVELDCNSAKIAGEIQRKLYELGEPAGSIDTLIAAVCIANNIPLITTDNGFQKFKRFGLRILTP